MWMSCARRMNLRPRGLPSLRRFGVAQFELVLAQRALCRRTEHRRVSRNSEHARRAAHRGDARGCGRLPGAPRSVCRSTGWRNRTPEGRGGAGRDRAGFSARQDARADQDRARRQDRGLVARAPRSRSGRRTCRATTPRRRRRLRQTKSRRRSTARSPSWKRIAGVRPAMRACGSFRKAMRTTRGR